LREAVVALKLETFYSKDDILLMYLNRVFLGGDTSGFEDASRYFFEKPAKELTLAEAATLVGILPAPNAFDFCGSGSNKLQAAEYRNRVIKRLLEMGKIKPEDANRARRSTVQVSPKVCEQQAKTIAPYFYSYVFSELESILGQGAAREGNYIIETKLDPTIQSQAEAALRNSVNNGGANFNFSQGAVVTLDSSTGSILAMVGGTDYKKSQFNRAVQAKRQPGSTFKIFTYTAAIEQGISPSKDYSCAPLTWQGFTYKPCRSSAGSLDIATGLALSENPIALGVAKEIGLNKVVAMAQRLGIKSSLDPVPGLVLGQSVVNVLEMTGAFGAIGNGGVRNPPHAINRILDSGDCRDRNDIKTCRVIYSFDQDPDANKRVLTNGVADEMTSLMRGVITRGTGRSAALGLGEAGKTGTTDKNVDLWFIGFIPSQRLVTGVWLGNDNNSPTSGSSAQAAQLWGNYMRRVTR
jgi:peptidoglycan glycosyltransferase